MLKPSALPCCKIVSHPSLSQPTQSHTLQTYPNPSQLIPTHHKPRNRFQGMNSASRSLAGRYDNPIPNRLLAPIDFFKIPAQSISHPVPSISIFISSRLTSHPISFHLIPTLLCLTLLHTNRIHPYTLY